MAKRPRASQQSGTSSIAFNLQPNNLGQKATRSLKAGLRPSRSTFNLTTFNLTTFNPDCLTEVLESLQERDL
ncbi:MAG: hypothetical protein F6J94_15725 [Moorea sp. SIO1F2]|uniref:hypothetical protein n=1 Tax=Moorena sp. SIO1F2 TaxID=2607819 RepID=UPI0013B99792|nr:hypothetical protein [Moorena sp. SIO1F2]NET83311.1 hypothetical protein [Moorena sp. SIO1F2]